VKKFGSGRRGLEKGTSASFEGAKEAAEATLMRLLKQRPSSGSARNGLQPAKDWAQSTRRAESGASRARPAQTDLGKVSGGGHATTSALRKR
jgi:hypothetical protein